MSEGGAPYNQFRSSVGISEQIANVQASTTGAVGAIARIASRMQDINECTGTVASAVLQQGDATAKISQNVANAAQGTRTTVSVLAELNRAADATKASAQLVLDVSEEVEVAAEQLENEVGRFLREVAA